MIATFRTSSLPDHKEALEDELDQRDEEADESETESDDRENVCRGAGRRRFVQLVSTSYLRDGQRSDDEESDKLTRQTDENETHPKRTSESGERLTSGEEEEESCRGENSEDDDYDPEREYYSDPDFHDERPPKGDSKREVATSERLTIDLPKELGSSLFNSSNCNTAESSDKDTVISVYFPQQVDEPSGEPIVESYELVKFDEAQTSDVLGEKEYCSEARRIGTAEEQDASLTKSSDERKRLLLMEVLEDYCDKLVDLVKKEALKQVEEMMKSGKTNMLNMRAILESSSEFESKTSKCAASEKDEDGNLDQPNELDELKCRRAIYTSSLFYDDKRGSFPTIEQQLESCQTIAKQLKSFCNEEDGPEEEIDGEACVNVVPKSEDKVARLYRRRRRRANKYTFSIDNEESDEGAISEEEGRNLESSSSEQCLKQERQSRLGALSKQTSVAADFRWANANEEEVARDLASLTDTEYEAPSVRLAPRRHNGAVLRSDTKSKLAARARYRPFLDSSTLKDIEMLRLWCPKGQINEHSSPEAREACAKLATDLKLQCDQMRMETQDKEEQQVMGLLGSQIVSRGAQMFERRAKESTNWVVGGDCEPENGNPIEGGDTLASGQAKEEREEGQHFEAGATGEIDGGETGAGLIGEGERNDHVDQIADELMELAPVVAKQWPGSQLELATITRTPSFSTSSRRIIECDSHESLSSQEADEEDQEEQIEDKKPTEDREGNYMEMGGALEKVDEWADKCEYPIGLKGLRATFNVIIVIFRSTNSI